MEHPRNAQALLCRGETAEEVKDAAMYIV